MQTGEETIVEIEKHFDLGSWLVILATLGLFVAALFVKGFTHDLLLEGGVFLVSVKLIIMAYKNSVSARAIARRLDEIRDMLERMQAGPPNQG